MRRLKLRERNDFEHGQNRLFNSCIERRVDYNESRPYQALGERTPMEYALGARNLERSIGFQTAEI